MVARLERPLLQQEEQRQRYLGEDRGAPPVHEDLSEISVYLRSILEISIACVYSAYQIPDVEKDVSAEDAGERLGDPLPQVDLDVGKVRQVALLPVPLRFLQRVQSNFVSESVFGTVAPSCLMLCIQAQNHSTIQQ